MSTISRQSCGAILMALAMLTIPLVDGLAKHLSASYSPLFLGWTRYTVASLIVYLELLGAVLVDYFAFDEIPDFSSLLGAGFIVVAGLLLLQRQDR